MTPFFVAIPKTSFLSSRGAKRRGDLAFNKCEIATPNDKNEARNDQTIGGKPPITPKKTKT